MLRSKEHLTRENRESANAKLGAKIRNAKGKVGGNMKVLNRVNKDKNWARTTGAS
jgi:hypothetical protein